MNLTLVIIFYDLESLKLFRALNTDGTVKYEIVYVELIDNKQGVDSVTGLSKSPSIKTRFT